MPTDYYKTLEVSREASADEIRKSYKKLARKYHPDMNQDNAQAADQFKQVQEAFDILGDSEKREQYDRYGTAFRPGAGPHPNQKYSWQGGGQPGGFDVDLGDMLGGQVDLGSLFGGGNPFGQGRPGSQQRPRATKGKDHRIEIQVPFQVATEGGEHRLELDRGGKTERLTVKIPPGVDNGSVIRLAGEGSPGTNSGSSGDLLITIRVGAHPYFRREANNLLVDVPITISEALLGAKVEVPTLTEGKVVLTIPRGSSSGTKLRLREKGIPDRKTGERGDQFVVLKIVVPSEINQQGENLIREFAQQVEEDPRANLW